jgi:hypothetical protein
MCGQQPRKSERRGTCIWLEYTCQWQLAGRYNCTGFERLDMAKKVADDKPRAHTAEEGRDKVLELVASYVDYWDKEARVTTSKEKLEGLAFSIMVIFDGGTGLPGFTVKANPHRDDKAYHIKNGENYFDPKLDIAGGLHEHIHKFFKK